MKPETPASVAATSVILFGLMLATMLAGDAQTWHWTYVTRSPNSPLVVAQSSVAVAASSVRMAYTVPLQNRQVVIESCTADVHDIQNATTVRSGGTAYLLIRFKPSRSADCVSGKRPAVALPTNDDRSISNVAAALNQSCCSVAPATTPRARPAAKLATAASAPIAQIAKTVSPARNPPVAATPSPVLTATRTPGPRPTSAPRSVRVQDGVESEGLFSFIRVRNAGNTTLTIAGEVFDCHNVDTGCGPLTADAQLTAGSTATVATITSKDQNGTPTFRYRYTAGDGEGRIAVTASWAKTAAPRIARMSAQELRTAQAHALGALRSTPHLTVTPVVPARLVKRGSSRLAIGQTGTAVVRLTIAPSGTPQEATIVSISNKQLSAAAIETAVSSTYAPAVQNGRAIAAKYVATFSFDGEDPALSSVPVWKRAPSPSPEATSSADATPQPR